MSEIQQTVGKNIRFSREAAGLTQELLAEKVGVSGSYIGYLERGKKSPSLSLLCKISDVLHIDPAMLFKSSESKKDQELTKLILTLSDKEVGSIKFLNQVAIAYFKSIEE